MRSLGEAIKGHVGASLLAMVVNDGACLQAKRGALGSIASRLAPTGIALALYPGML